MSVLHLCDEEPAVVHPETTAADAIQLMLARRVGAVGVVDQAGTVLGIFTERDVLRKLALSGRDPSRTPVSELMTAPVVLATANTKPGEALAVMVEHHFRHLPVVDDRGRLMAMLSIRNLLESQVDELTNQLDTMEQYMTNDAPGG
ncbi:MAG: CBS domain-containing protein [Terriglobales bacterium]